MYTEYIYWTKKRNFIPRVLTVLPGSWIFDTINVLFFKQFKHSFSNKPFKPNRYIVDFRKYFFFNTVGVQNKNHRYNNRVCMLLTGLSATLSKNDSCKIVHAGFRNARKKTFQTEFINLYQNLLLNLDAFYRLFNLTIHLPQRFQTQLFCVFVYFWVISKCFLMEEILSNSKWLKFLKCDAY